MMRDEPMHGITIFSHANKMTQAYHVMLAPLCREAGMPPLAMDILLFLANNPTYKTASDIVEVRHIKANLVSVNVDKLVHEGLLTRRPVPNDRRKTELLCTEKAQPIIQRGRALQEAFFDRLLNGIDEARLNVFYGTLEQMGRNLDEILEGEL